MLGECGTPLVINLHPRIEKGSSMNRDHVDGAKLLCAVRGACAIAILTAPPAPVYTGDSNFKEDVKQVGRAVTGDG